MQTTTKAGLMTALTLLAALAVAAPASADPCVEFNYTPGGAPSIKNGTVHWDTGARYGTSLKDCLPVELSILHT